jgi:hypothetical protein
VELLRADWKLTLRRLAKAPGVAATVLTLTIGIGANTAVYSVINSAVLRPSPYPEVDRLVALRRGGSRRAGPDQGEQRASCCRHRWI